MPIKNNPRSKNLMLDLDHVKKFIYIDDLFNKDSSFSHSKVEKMRNTYTRAFGTDKRKGPEYRHKLFVPGPGLYETFSSFGTNYQQRHFRSVTEG